MSMVRVVTRIIPADASEAGVSALLSPAQVAQPLGTTSRVGHVGHLRTETTFCRAVDIPRDCANVDREVAKGCERIDGLVGLKKSRLKVVTETRRATEVSCEFRVTPEMAPDGTCTGMLLSLPLTIPRSQMPLGECQNPQSTFVGDLNYQGPRGFDPKSDRVQDPAQVDSFYSNNEAQGSVDLEGANGGSVLTQLTTAKEKSELSRPCPLRFKKEQFTCDQCGKKFPGKRHLVLHSRQAHSGIPCPLCKVLFPSGKHIKAHMGEAHTGQLPHGCPTCGARFLTANTLRDHQRQHRKKERRNRCAVCGKGFAHEKLLQSHMAGVHFSEGFC